LIEHAGFWEMQATTSDNDVATGEGTTWILEARNDDRYHVTSRWQPMTPHYLEIGRLMLSLAGVTEAELAAGAAGVELRPPRPQPGDPPAPPGMPAPKRK
jgi:hypothetical protein